MKREEICTTANVKKICGLHPTLNHGGKMTGMQSMSTSPTINTRCAKNALNKDSVCFFCFSQNQMKRFPSMEKPLQENYRILTGSILPFDMLPIINALYFRFEAFGDLGNATQAKNYFNICYKNPNVNFALWTKNPDYIAQAIADGYDKPDNLNIILSSLFTNKERKNVFPFVDKVFTVYDPDYIKENNVPINCGERKCLDCLLCYKKNGVEVINEKLK